MTASSNGGSAPSGRLNNNGAWCADTTSGNQYLQADLGMTSTVSGLAIQGDNKTFNWVTKFKVLYGITVGSLSTYQYPPGVEKVRLFVFIKYANPPMVKSLRLTYLALFKS